MNVSTLTLLGLIPTGLVIMGGLLILYTGGEQAGRRRLLLYLLSVGLLLLLVKWTAAHVPSQVPSRPDFLISYLMIPSILGVIVLILVNVRAFTLLSPIQKIFAVLLATGMLILLVSQLNGQYAIYSEYLVMAVLLAVLWSIRRYLHNLDLLLGLLAGLSLFTYDLFGIAGRFQRSTSPPTLEFRIYSFIFFWLPVAVAALVAILLYNAFRHPTDWVEKPKNSLSWTAYLRLGLAIFLVGSMAYRIYWETLWDRTNDGLSGLFYGEMTAVFGIAAGMLLTLALRKQKRVVGSAFTVGMPLLAVAAFSLGIGSSYHAITRGRAARIQQALESYASRTGGYPERLSDLTPQDLPFIQGPVILRGETWCYQGESDYYRLGALYREFFSAPISIHIYASAGTPPDPEWECQQQYDALKEVYNSSMEMEEAFVIPTPSPQPESIITGEKMLLEPVVASTTLITAGWSPDNRYLLFAENAQALLSRPTVGFLEGKTGEVCQMDAALPPGPEIRNRYAWLPDGRVLFVTQPGEIEIIQPCSSSSELERVIFNMPFNQVGAFDSSSGKILLKSKDAFGILDSQSLHLKEIEGVSPNPYEFHWDNYAWLPGGTKLAISRLNDQDRKAGSTLYILDGETGELRFSLPMSFASDQSSPRVEWLNADTLLLDGEGTWTLMDISGTEPKLTNLLRDIFELDLDYPEDLSASANLVDRDGKNYHLILRANHVRDHSIYVYHSETGQVEVLADADPVLLIFPDGRWVDMPPLFFGPPIQDHYTIHWIDDPQRDPLELTIEGHQPRDYPSLWVAYLPPYEALVFASAQGYSLVSLSTGEMMGFYKPGMSQWNNPSVPDSGEALVGVGEATGLFNLTPQLVKIFGR